MCLLLGGYHYYFISKLDCSVWAICMRFNPVGECIYCGVKNVQLTDEHIFPYALGGTNILPLASCKNCAQITSKFELDVLRNHLSQVRTKLNFPSRRSVFPSTLPITVKLGEDAKTFYLPKTEHPTMVSFLLYPLPGVLGGNAPEQGINVIGIQTYQVGGPSLEETLRSLGSKEVTFSEKFSGNNFERLLAKIAFGCAVAKFGIDFVRFSPLKSIILGVTDDSGRWIGCGRFVPESLAQLHVVSFEKNHGWLIAKVRLFARMTTPEYIVVVLEGDSKYLPSLFHGDISESKSI